jgi:hypothetical protein
MARKSFMPHTHIGQLEMQESFIAALPKYQTRFDLSDEDIATVINDTYNLRHAYTLKQHALNFSHNCTAYFNLLLNGGSDSAVLPVLSALPPSLASSVVPGATARFASLVARIKAHKNYTEAIGQDLQIIGPVIVIDPASWKPALSIQHNAGHPVIVWTKGQAGAIEIWANRDDGRGFAFFTINTEPNTLDNTPLPPPDTAVNWQYKAIYRLHDEQVGQWSDVLSILAGG